LAAPTGGKLTAWLPQKPGFVGQVYYVHKTALDGLFEYGFQSERGGELTAVVASNHWITLSISR
jgi:hypothetical protein